MAQVASLIEAPRDREKVKGALSSKASERTPNAGSGRWLARPKRVLRVLKSWLSRASWSVVSQKREPVLRPDRDKTRNYIKGIEF